MRIADLLDELEQEAEITGIRDACLDVLTDNMWLPLKPAVNDTVWRRSYQETVRTEPTVYNLQQRAESAILRTEELLNSGRLISSALPTYEQLVVKTKELLRRLREYKDSIPTYFNNSLPQR